MDGRFLSLVIFSAIPVCPSLLCRRAFTRVAQLGTPRLSTSSSLRSQADITSSSRLSDVCSKVRNRVSPRPRTRPRLLMSGLFTRLCKYSVTSKKSYSSIKQRIFFNYTTGTQCASISSIHTNNTKLYLLYWY